MRPPPRTRRSRRSSKFDDLWGRRYPMIGELWRRQWERVTPFFEFPPDIRRIVDTTDSIEAVNRQLRTIIKTRGHFPTEDAALKLPWLALMRAEKKWTYPIREWGRALHQFAIYLPDRVPETIAAMEAPFPTPRCQRPERSPPAGDVVFGGVVRPAKIVVDRCPEMRSS
ncbi:MAG: transposase [Acidimicrobiales bacterium]